MGNLAPSAIIGALLATLSGVIVALFTGYLSTGREAARERRLVANTRALLALEVRSNHDALAAHWRTLTALAARQPGGDDSTPPAPGSAEELAAMYANGLASYALPLWSTVRWNGIEPRTVAALSASEVMALDGLYRALREVSDLYSRVTTITSDDWTQLQKNVGGRFWNNDLARDRQPLYARLRAAVARVLDAADPLPGAIATGQ